MNAPPHRYANVTSRPLSEACLMASTKRCSSTRPRGLPIIGIIGGVAIGSEGAGTSLVAVRST